MKLHLPFATVVLSTLVYVGSATTIKVIRPNSALRCSEECTVIPNPCNSLAHGVYDKKEECWRCCLDRVSGVALED